MLYVIIYSVTVSDVLMALGAIDPEGTQLGMAVVLVDNNDIGYWQVLYRTVLLKCFMLLFVWYIVPT